MKQTVKTVEVEKKVVLVTLNKDEFLECGAKALVNMLDKIDPPDVVADVLVSLFGRVMAKMTCYLFDTEEDDDKED